MSEPYNRPLLVSILDYLSTLRQLHPDQLVDAENVDVALQCLSEATGLRLTDAETAALKPTHSLANIFTAGVAALSTSASSPPPQRFEEFISTLTGKGYFSGVTVGSAEYQARMEQAKSKYAEKYPSANTTPPQTNKAVTDADKSAAEKLKSEGNTALAAGKLNDAYVKYTAAIALNPHNAVYYANRAAVLITQTKFEQAIADCRRAIDCDSSYTKAHYRLGTALVSLHRPSEAKSAFERALDLSRDDPAMSVTIREQLAKLSDDDDDTDGGSGGGGMDFNALLNNPDIARMFGGGGDSGAPDLSSLLSNPALMQMAQSMFGGLGNNANAAAQAAQAAQASGNATMAAAAAWGASPDQPSTSSAANPSGVGGGMESLLNGPVAAELMNDPDLSPVIADVRANGQSALFKHMSNPTVMRKLQSLIGPMMSQFGGRGAA